MQEKIRETLNKTKPLDSGAQKKVQDWLDQLVKPQGSLGRLEDLAVQLGGISGGFFPSKFRKKIVIMAADHGVAAEGVSLYPSEVTGQMVMNFINGGAAINVLSRLVGSEVRVVDMGVAADLNIDGLSKAGIRVGGTGNFAKELAMSREEAQAALLYGIGIAEEEVISGVQVLATGEMGIGNTTASSAAVAALTGLAPSVLVGRGTGLGDAGLAHKISVVERALELHKPDPADPLDVLSKVGGLEIAGLCGLILGAAASGCPVVLDGFISTAAALLAVKLSPSAFYYLIPSHLSQEPGHGPLLEFMGLKPLLHLNMRLGEGTGAALCMNLLEGAVRLLSEMPTFAEAGVSEKKGGVNI